MKVRLKGTWPACVTFVESILVVWCAPGRSSLALTTEELRQVNEANRVAIHTAKLSCTYQLDGGTQRLPPELPEKVFQKPFYPRLSR